MIDTIDHRSLQSVGQQSPGDVDAFTAFVAEVEPRLRRALAGTVGIDMAADATAEALTYAWTNWARVARMKNPAGYLYRVGRSAGRVRLPSRGRRVRWPFATTSTMPEFEPKLLDAVAALPDRQRAAVWLVHACEWTRSRSVRHSASALPRSRPTSPAASSRSVARSEPSMSDIHADAHADLIAELGRLGAAAEAAVTPVSVDTVVLELRIDQVRDDELLEPANAPVSTQRGRWHKRALTAAAGIVVIAVGTIALGSLRNGEAEVCHPHRRHHRRRHRPIGCRPSARGRTP